MFFVRYLKRHWGKGLCCIFVLCFITVTGTYAHPYPSMSRKVVKKSTVTYKGYFMDARHHHDRSYPYKGRVFHVVPRNHKVVIHGHMRYILSGGVWYVNQGNRYVVVAPPVGVFLPTLPFSYTVVWFRGIPYYYANETYYLQVPGGYVVAPPPPSEQDEEITPDTGDEGMDVEEEKMFVYPRKGQTDKQQEVDRYDCHRWAMEQTGYDPTQVPLEGFTDEMKKRREDYRRAMAACLDSRGYAVR